MAKATSKAKKATAQTLVLSDTEKRQRKESAEGKRTVLAGMKFDDLKPAEKDTLLKSLLESRGWIDAAGTVL